MDQIKQKKIAFLFSGQGAQYSGMGKELAEISPAAQAVFTMADAVRPGTSEQCFAGSKELLSQTINTQPCLFCVDLAAAEALKETGIMPVAVAGFSLGELAALAFVEAMSYEAAFRLVCRRAEAMDESSRKTNSTMAAVIKLPTETVKEVCAKYEGIYPVNFNCAQQTVVAGKVGGFDEFAAEIKSLKGRVMPLSVSGGFHSPYMAEAAEKFERALQEFTYTEATMPVYANYTAKPYDFSRPAMEVVPEMLHKQMSNPVIWEDTMKNMIADGIEIFVEVGAGKTLSNLLKKIAPEAVVYQVDNAETLAATKAALLGE